MIKWVVTMKSKRPRWLARSSFNEMMRAAMTEAGEHWLKTYLPMHLGNAAVSRYGYNFRSGVWHQIKNTLQAEGRRPAREDESLIGRSDARVIRNGKYVVWTVPGHFENEVNYWHGDMKRMVLAQAESGAAAGRIKATATEGRYRLRVPVQIPHPVQPKFAGEMTKLTRGEKVDLARIIMRAMKRMFGLNVKTSVERIVQ